MPATRRSALLLFVIALGSPALADEAETAVTAYRRALTLQSDGRAAAARAAYQRVLALEPDHLAARRALGFVRVEGRWLTTSQAAEAADAAPAPAPAQPRAAAVTPALVARILADPDPVSRARGVDALKRLCIAGAKDALVRALSSPIDATRTRAAEALGLLGDLSAMGALIAQWEARSGNFPRVYLSQSSQISYIQDFDVEVASTSFIADPLVGVIQAGVVQAFRIHDTVQTFTTVERTTIHQALQHLGGYDVGPDPKAWAAFWAANRERLLREGAVARRSEAAAK